MKYPYSPGSKRAFRWTGDGDVRGYRPPSGWSACAEMTDTHPHHRPAAAAQ